MKHFLTIVVTVLCGAAILSACERSPAEKLAILHSEQQSRINSANFERSAQLREIKDEKEDAADDGDE